MFWIPKIITNIFLVITIILSMVTVLIILLLIPSITQGPNNIISLQRTNCTLTNITYLNNYCLRDTSTDFTNLVYQPDWIDCTIAVLNITSDLNSSKNCSWIYPTSFTNNNDAFLAISQQYELGNKYPCIIDTSQKICYPDKHEVLIFSVSISSLFFATFITFIIYIVLKIYYKKKDALNDNSDVEKNSIKK
jgi:hypothetical protein